MMRRTIVRRDAAFSLTWLPGVLRDAGLMVVEQPGWQTRGRGDVGTIVGVMCHHTAGPADGIMPSLDTVIHGRPDLPGPLAQLCLGRDGMFFVVAAGRCNHAGLGKWQGISTGNSSFIGIEAENTGLTTGPNADPWPDVQMDAYRRGVAAILTKIGAEAIMCCGHREYALPAGRKSDPSFDMNDFRRLLRAYMAGRAAGSRMLAALGVGPTMRRGDEGEFVRIVQAAVGVPVTGIFDAATEDAVRAFQRANGLVPDGIVGPRTWAAVAGV